MKIYFKLIKYIQETLLFISILILMFLPLTIVFHKELLSSNTIMQLYEISHYFLFFVMIIRPLADIFSGVNFIRPLVILRKGAGVLSASIVVSFILAKLMVDPTLYFESINTLKYWSFENYAILAHLADISAVILLVTSNNFSKRILGDWWKSIQQLSYVYFYASVIYVYLSYGDNSLLIWLASITLVIFVASIKNKERLK